MKNNNLSIITPSFNQAAFIERTIQSVLSQQFSGLEYIVIDGASTDGTVDILKKYSHDLQWISEPDQGQTHAVNKGIQKTSGAIIGWLNSDDIYYPDAFQRVCDFFDAHPEIDVIYGDANHIDSNDHILESYPTENWNSDRLKEVCYLCQPAVFFRRSVIDRFGKLNETLHYSMDYEFWLRLASKGARFFHLKSVLAGSRLHPDTKTLGARFKVHKEINDMLKEKFDTVPDSWLRNYAHVITDTTHPNKALTGWRLHSAIEIRMILAALKWNKGISKPHWHTIIQKLTTKLHFIRRKSLS